MAEILRALRDGTLNFEERLKVACHVARNGNPGLLESKTTFLIKWACEELCNAYSKKNRSHPRTKVCSQLWLFLATMLESQHHSSRKQRHLKSQAEMQAPISIHLVQAMCDVLGSPDAGECIKPVLSCLEHILKNKPLPSVLYKFEVVASLLLSVLVIAGSKEGVEEEVVEREREESVLCLILDHFIYLQGTQGNQKKVFTTVCNQLLSPVITLRYSSQFLDDCSTVGDRLDTLLRSLFSKDHLAEYSSALSHTTVPIGKRSAVSYTKLLFECLQKLLTSQDVALYQAVLNAIPSIFESFLQQNSEGKRLSKGIEFQFFLKLVFLLGFPVTLTTGDSHTLERESTESKAVRKGEDRTERERERVGDEEEMEEEEEEEGVDKEMMSNGDHDSMEEGEEEEEEKKGEEKEVELDWDVLLARVLRKEGMDGNKKTGDSRRFSCPVLRILAKCLHLLKTYAVYEVVLDQSNGNRQFDFLSDLCIEIVEVVYNYNLTAVTQFLEEALQLNHKLVEPLLAGLLLLATTTSNLTKRMGSFVQTCIDIYSKLHQLSVLVGKLFLALEKVAMSSHLPRAISPVLSKPSEYWFCKRVQDLPLGQSLGLLEQLIHSLKSIFLAKIQPPCISQEDRNEDRRKKKRRLSNGKNGELSTFEFFPRFAAALTRGVNVLSLVLVNTPVSVWCNEGIHRDRAMAVLLTVKKEVCIPLMKIIKAIPEFSLAALSLSHSLQCLLFCLRDMRPIDTLIPESGTISRDSALFVSDEMRVVWNESLGKPIPEVWTEEDEKGAATNYILKAMSVVELRFQKDRCSREDIAHLLDFIFEEVESMAASKWSGQPLDINERNFPVAVWDLALSNLPLLYQDCQTTHLKNVASFLYTALLQASFTAKDKRKDENEGQTVQEVALSFLHSVSFQDMRLLQELLLSTCFEKAAIALPKSLKELRTPLLRCSAELLDSSVHLKEVVEQHGLQSLLSGGEDREDKAVKRRKSVLKSAQHLSVCLEVMKVIPMAFTHPEILHRCSLVLTISHIGLVHSLQPSGQEALSQLSEVQLVLARVLLSLVHRDRAGKKKTPHLSPLPFEQLLTWMYTAAQYCSDLVEDKGLQFRVSCLLGLEAALECALKSGSYPTGFVQQVVSDVTKSVTDEEEACAKSLPLPVFQLTVTKICKVYSGLKPSQRDRSFLHEPVIQLLQETAIPLSHMRKKGPETVQLYPQLVSSFCLLLKTNPPPHVISSSKSLMKVAKFLFDSFCSDVTLQSATSNNSILFSAIDCLTLPTIEGERQADKHFTVTESWCKLVTLLQKYLNENLDKNGGYLVQLCCSGVGGNSSLSCDSSAGRVVPLFSGAMTQLLASANREQTTSMFQILHKESCDSVEAAMAVCYCWRVILTAKFQPESQRELRKWHIKILLQCEALAIQHRGSAPVIIMSLSITTHLVGLPTRVGLDSRLVLMSLHQTAVLQSIPEVKSHQCLVMQSVGWLLFTVLKNHSTVASSCPGPVVTALNNLVVALLEQCTGWSEGDSERDGDSVANAISRVFDHLAGQQEFTRYVPCILSSYVAAVVKHPPMKSIKTALLPGVYSLLRQCTEQGSAFLQASLDSTARLHFHSLLEDFRKQKRYL